MGNRGWIYCRTLWKAVPWAVEQPTQSSAQEEALELWRKLGPIHSLTKQWKQVGWNCQNNPGSTRQHNQKSLEFRLTAQAKFTARSLGCIPKQMRHTPTALRCLHLPKRYSQTSPALFHSRGVEVVPGSLAWEDVSKWLGAWSCDG